MCIALSRIFVHSRRRRTYRDIIAVSSAGLDGDASRGTRPGPDLLNPRKVFATRVAAALLFCGCASGARLSILDGMGPLPTLPAPRTSLIPTVNVATAKGWAEGTTPIAGKGMHVDAFASSLEHPRWLHVLPNGDVLVAETNSPPRPDDMKGIRGWFIKRYRKRAGGAVPSANRISLLRDSDGDGVAELRTVLLSGLRSPFGMALVDSTLYVATTDALVRFRYHAGDTVINDTAVLVAPLPAGTINRHWTRSLVASPDGKRLYVGVGSNSNAAEHGIEAEEGRAAIWEIDPATGFHTIYASGLRNPVGMAWDDEGGLWVAVNERDEIGSDVPPDFMTRVVHRGFYGFPYSYFGANIDKRVKPQRPDLVSRAIIPDYALGPHTAPLGLAYVSNASLSPRLGAGMFVGQHGSWNRKPLSGYKVIFVQFHDGRPQGGPMDILTGFVNEKGEAYGRPVGVAIGKDGALLVADDVGNTIWRVTRAR